MDHKVSKDMISSGMIPSGEKTQADLGRTQYGSAPSPSKLMDAYKSMYKEENIDEMAGVSKIVKGGRSVRSLGAKKPEGSFLSRQKAKLAAETGKKPTPKVYGQTPTEVKTRADKDSSTYAYRPSDADNPRDFAIAKKPETTVTQTSDADKAARRARVKEMESQGKVRKTSYEKVDLLAAYREVYEHHKKDADGNTIPHEGEEVKEENINELKSRTMLDYIDKASDSASKELNKAEKTTSRKKEVKARLKMDKRERGIEMAKDKIMKRVKEEYDLVYEHFIGEGFSEEETYERMSNLTEEQLDEFMKALATRAAQYGANLGKKNKVDYIGGIKRKPFEAKRKPFDPKPKPGEQGFKAKSASDVVMSAAAMNRKKETVSNQTKDSGQNIMDKNKIKGAKGPNNMKDVRLPFEQVDTYDVMLNHFLNEGYQREDIIKAMSSLSEEPISLAVLGGLLAKGGAMAAKGAAVAGKAAMGAAKAGAGAMKGAMKGVVSAAKPVTKTVSKVATKIKKDPMGAIDNVRRVTDTVDSAKNLITPTNQNLQKKPAAGQVSTGSNVYSSADLFDIVKGQLLDEGMSEEEIKDIMLTLTPDEIMEELSDVVKRNDALNRERAMKAAQERKVPDKVREASKRQYTAGGPKDTGANKYTTQDKKTIIDYNKNKESM